MAIELIGEPLFNPGRRDGDAGWDAGDFGLG
jgi:hypothetical protein